MQIALCITVVQKHATMTQTASTKNATPTTINVDWIRTALIGPSAVRSLNAGMVRVTAIMMGNVKDHLCAALTIVLMDQLFWIAVNRRYTKVNHIEYLKFKIYAAL